ncbi:ABC transporter permease [Tsukamurella soli]|uniref:ABC transporter permease n=1 Tax=Tsukamurella soli TaxID=644556 RepID=UPI003616AA5A
MNWVGENWGQIATYGLAHVWLSVIPIVIGTVVAVPIGWVANRRRLSRGVLLSITGVLYAIPSLPLFVVLPSLLGTKILSPVNVVVALTIYAVALMVRSAADAFAAVDGGITLSAVAVGYGGWRRFWGSRSPWQGRSCWRGSGWSR